MDFEQIIQALLRAHAAGDLREAARLAALARAAAPAGEPRPRAVPGSSGASPPASPAPSSAAPSLDALLEAVAAEEARRGGGAASLAPPASAPTTAAPAAAPSAPSAAELRARLERLSAPAASAAPPLTAAQQAAITDALGRAQPAAPPIPGLGIPPGVDANALGGPPENAGALAALLTPEGQAARRPLVDPQIEELLALARQAQEAERRRTGGADLTPEERAAIMASAPRAGLSGEALRAEIDANSVHYPGPLERFATRARDNLDGLFWDGDGDASTIANRGEALAAALNNAGEAMTFGLIGDEADAALRGAGAALVPGGQGFSEAYAERVADKRAQEAALWEQRPGLALTSELGGALMGPGAPARFINRGVGLLSRLGRGAAVGAGSGAIYGAAEAERDMAPAAEMGAPEGGLADRVVGGLLGAAIGGAGGAALTGLGQGFIRAAQALRGRPGGEEAAASVAGLRDASQALYRASDEAGVVVPQDALSRLLTTATDTVRREGFNPRLHPRLRAVLGELADVAKGDQSLGRLEIARRVAGNAARSLEPDERRLASLVIDKIDDAIEGLGDGSAPLRQARELWARMSRLGRVEEIMEAAANAGPNSSPEAAMANAFRSFLRNPRNLRDFTEAEVRAMQGIARGTGPVRALRGLADLLAPNSLTGAGAAVGTFLNVSQIGAVVPPLASWGARAAANGMVRAQGRGLLERVGQTDAQRATADALLRQPNAGAGLATAPVPMGVLEYLGGR